MTYSPDPQADSFLDGLFAGYDKAKQQGEAYKAKRTGQTPAEPTPANELLSWLQQSTPPGIKPEQAGPESNDVTSVAKFLRRQYEGW